MEKAAGRVRGSHVIRNRVENLHSCYIGRRRGRPIIPADPFVFRYFDWLRGLDLNQRPLGYEFGKGQVGNPLIFRGKCSVIVSYTFSIHA